MPAPVGRRCSWGRAMKQHAIRLWVAVVGVAAGLMALRPVHTSDAFWHLMLGRAVLRAGSRTVPEPAAFEDFAGTVVVPEWLWEVFSYGVYAALGPEGLSVLTALCAAIGAILVVWMLRVLCPQASHPALVFVSAAAVASLAARMQARPQLGFLILLPLFVVCSVRYAEAEGRSRGLLGGAIALTAALWAQIHGSFVLAPLLFAVCVLPGFLADWHGPRRTGHLAVILGIGLATLSSADGVDVVHYILSHASGDAARHVGDMGPTRWEDVRPGRSPYGTAFVVLVLLIATGVAGLPRRRFTPLALAILGGLLAANSVRFVAVGSLLIAPLALDCLDHLAARIRRPLPKAVVAVVLAGLLLGWSAKAINERYGPPLTFGWAEGRQPELAARYFGARAGTPRVLTSFDAGSALGFWLDGGVRTYIDTRTPLHFDDADYGVAREVWFRPDALALGLSRYRADGLVTERDTLTCSLVPEGWVPVVVDARFSSFVPAGEGEALEAIAACGGALLVPEACSDGGQRLDAEVARMAALHRSPFTDFLRVQRILACGGDLAEAERLMPSREDAWHYRKAWALSRAQLDWRAGRPDLARARLEKPARFGDVESMGLLLRIPADAQWMRDVLEAHLRKVDDQGQVEFRAQLALICSALGDAECVRFHGMRAAVSGSPHAPRLLSWLRAHHPEERIRRDSDRWLGTLRGDPSIAQSGVSAPREP